VIGNEFRREWKLLPRTQTELVAWRPCHHDLTLGRGQVSAIRGVVDLCPEADSAI